MSSSAPDASEPPCSGRRARRRRGLAAAFAVLAACSAPVAEPSDASPDGARDAGPIACATDRDCADGVFCNGTERCMPESPRAAADGCVPSETPPCPNGTACDDAADRCTTLCGTTMDADGDGVTAADCGGTDCDDADAMRYPGASETCDAGHDEDCDPTTLGTRDADADGATSSACCNGAVCGLDCDDAHAAVHVGAGEVCNDRDDDCDASTDEGVRASYWPDMDQDLYGDAFATPIFACAPGPHEVQNALDCDDESSASHPGAAELCNGRDDDCDGVVDNEDAAAFACAATYGSPAFTTFSCTPTGCAIACTAQHLDCNSRLDDGCETDSDADVDHCGRCDRSCGAAGTCSAAQCDPIVALSAGQTHTCIVRASGVAACWGANYAGQLGDRSYTTRGDPVRVQGLPSVTRIAGQNGGLGNGMTCASGGDALLCWGNNDFGALGDGTTTSHLDPTPVAGRFPPFVSFLMPGHLYQFESSGWQTCAIVEGPTLGMPPNRQLWCWGNNDVGQLGRGTTGPMQLAPANAPTPITLDVGAQVAVGMRNTCVTTGATGAVYCVGAGASGALGNGSSATSASWVRAGSANDVVAIDGNLDTFCWATAAGAVACWGYSVDDQHVPVRTPTLVPITGHVVDVEVGTTFQGRPFACALRDDGTVACWGGNDDGNLGRGTTGTSGAVGDVTGLDHVAQLSIGGFHACALRTDGSVWCWGNDVARQLGNAALGTTSSPVPVQVDRLPPHLP